MLMRGKGRLTGSVKQPGSCAGRLPIVSYVNTGLGACIDCPRHLVVGQDLVEGESGFLEERPLPSKRLETNGTPVLGKRF